MKLSGAELSHVLGGLCGDLLPIKLYLQDYYLCNGLHMWYYQAMEDYYAQREWASGVIY